MLQHRKTNTRHSAWPSNILPLLLCQKDTHDYRPQTASINFQQRGSNYTSGVAVYLTDRQIQDTHNLQIRIRLLHCCLAFNMNHVENRDEVIAALFLSINTIDTVTDIPP